MKIALCLSGMPRSVEEAYPYIKKAILDGNDVDIFAHTWLEDPWRKEHQSKKENHEIYSPPELDYETRVNEITKILTLYRPKSFSLDQYHIRQEYYESNENYSLATRWCSCMESVYIANELKKKYEEQNHFKYDCVIRCRYDHGLNEKIHFQDYNVQEYVYSIDVGKDPYIHINDAFVFSTSENMDKWSSLFLHMKEVAKVILENDQVLAELYKGKKMCIETHDMYAYWARICKLSPKIFKMNEFLVRVSKDKKQFC